MHTKGSFIVIDGTDGSGKGTQSELLLKRLWRQGYHAQLFDFPRYEEPSSHFVKKYLNSEYGTPDEVGPYRASVFYALDRYDASFALRKSLSEGTITLCNRYVSSNMGHQAGKIKDAVARSTFLSWLKEFEFELFEIPVPDVNILLYMPPEIGQRLVDEKSARSYTAAKRDAHEADLEHLKNASTAYLEIANQEGWKVICCVEDDAVTVRSREAIHDELYAYLLERAVV